MSEKEEGRVEPPKGKGGLVGLLALMVGVANLGATGFVAHRVLTLPSAHVAATEEKVESAGPGPIAKLEPFVVNLDEPSPRYLKTSLSLELTSPDGVSRFDPVKHQIRDAFLRYLSSLTVEATRGEQGKTKIRADLIARAQVQLGPEKIKNIFFDEFVIQ